MSGGARYRGGMILHNLTASPLYFRVGGERRGPAWRRERGPIIRVTVPRMGRVDLQAYSKLPGEVIVRLLGHASVRRAQQRGFIKLTDSPARHQIAHNPSSPPIPPDPAPPSPEELLAATNSEVPRTSIPMGTLQDAVADTAPLPTHPEPMARSEELHGADDDRYSEDWTLDQLLDWARRHGVPLSAAETRSRPKLLRVLSERVSRRGVEGGPDAGVTDAGAVFNPLTPDDPTAQPAAPGHDPQEE